MARFRTFSSYGFEIARNWGNSNGIEPMNREAMTVSLLAALLTKLDDIHFEQRSSDATGQAKQRSNNVVGDGWLYTIQCQCGAIPIPIEKIHETNLPPRARKALLRAGIRFVHEITEERLFKIRNCGIATTRILMEWRERQLENAKWMPSGATIP